MPEVKLAYVEFDQIEVKSLIQKLGSAKYAQREKAERDIQKMLTRHGYPLWYFLTNDDAAKQSPETQMRLQRILKSLSLTQGDTYHLKDGEGNSMPNAYCEVYEMVGPHQVFNKQFAKLIGRTTSQDNGDLCLPDLTPPEFLGQAPNVGQAPNGNQRPEMGIIVHAPSYGTAGTIVYEHRGRDIFLPLVKDGSKAASRSARGTVVDESGQPIADVVIKPQSIEHEGQGSYNLRSEGMVYSDHKGRFRAYGLPYKNENTILPAGVKFHLRLFANDYFPSSEALPNNEPKNLVLYRGKKFHRFSFKDPKVPADRSGVVMYCNVSVPPEKIRSELPHAYITEGARLLPGTYFATFHDGHGYDVRYKPIEVNADSPEILEFSLPEAETFRGKVFDGITNEPAAGVIVFGANGKGERKLASITNEQLESLQSAPLDELEKHPTALLLREAYGVNAITKTDERGEYSVTLSPSEEVYGFHMVAPEMLPFEVRALPSEKFKKNHGEVPKEIDDDNTIELDPMFRFPAARVHLTTKLPAGANQDQHVNMWPTWKIDDSVQPPWFASFTDGKKARHGLPGFYPSYDWLEAGGEDAGKQQTMTVPAGIQLQLQFRPQSQSGYGPIHVAEKILLKQGEEHDLGNFELQKTVPVKVLVVDTKGDVIEGVNIRHRYLDGNSWNIGVSTDFTGHANTRVATGMKGEFGAIDIYGPKGRLRGKNLKIPFEIGDNGPKTFTIRLTDEQVAMLPKESKE